MKKEFKKVALIAAMCSIGIFVTGCSDDNAETQIQETTMGETIESTAIFQSDDNILSNNNENNNETPISLEEEYGNKESFKLAQSFAESLKNENYDSILNLLNLPENSVVSTDNLSYVLQRSDFSYLIGSDITIDEFTDGTTKATAKLKSGSDIANLTLELNSNNEWEPVIPNLYTEDVVVAAPGKCEITINGIILDEENFAETNTEKNDGSVNYILTIPNAEVSAHIKTAFGEFDVIMSSDENGNYSIIPELSGEALNNSLNSFQTMFNEMLTKSDQGITDPAEYQSYFSDKADYNFVSTSITNLLNMKGDLNDWYNPFYTGINCQNIAQANSKSYIVSYDTADIDFTYSIISTKHLAGTERSNQEDNMKGNVILQKIDDMYKIVSSSTAELFMECD